MSEPTRAGLLLALLDGRSLPAGELARVVNLSAAATSLHLSKMTAGGLLQVTQEGRHRFYRIASVDVVHALEALGVIATHATPLRSLSPARQALRAARTCYDHLAGALAVELSHTLEAAGLLQVIDEQTYEVSSTGMGWFADALSIDVNALRQRRRVFARRCLDWTERRPHLAGALGAALLDSLLERRWVARNKDSRALSVTQLGKTTLPKLIASAADG